MNAFDYDFWRLTPPEDRQPARMARLDAIASVTAPLLIEGGDLQIDAVGVYDAHSGSLVSVIIGGNALAPHTVDQAIALLGLTEAVGPWGDDLAADKLDALIYEEWQDREADRADARHSERGLCE